MFSPRTPLAQSRTAFTLIELLVVISIIIVMTGLILPAFNTLGNSKTFARAVYDIAGFYEGARSYAMANNTYVFVGIGEFDSSKKPADAQTAGTGRVALVAFASRDGMRGYNYYANEAKDSWQQNYSKGVRFQMVDKLRLYENLHLAATLPPPTSGYMLRPGVDQHYRLGDPVSTSVTPIEYPLGADLTDTAAGRFHFDKVIYYDPHGVARMQYATVDGDEVKEYMEIGLQPTHGNIAPPAPTVAGHEDCAAIQLDPLGGKVRIYRP